MHRAYESVVILDKLPLHIETIAAYDDHLIVGLKQGHLLMYGVDTDDFGGIKLQLLKSSKNFSKKPIQQIAVVPDFKILIVLTDNIIQVVDIASVNFSPVVTISKTRGAHLFSVDVTRPTSLTGGTAIALRLCVVVRKKLQFYYWKNRNFHELRDDLSLPDVPKALSWCKESICAGCRGEYFLMKLCGEQKELFPTGRQPEPLTCQMQDDTFALGRDEQTIFVDADGNPSQTYPDRPVSWSDTPIGLVHDPPYLVAVLPRYIEIRTVNKSRGNPHSLMIQSLEFSRPRLIHRSKKGIVYIASTCNIWCLRLIPISQQIPHLLKEKHFELALNLTELSKDTPEEKKQQIQHIQNLYAFELFQKKQYPESMDVFYQLETDPSFVIGLFPELLPVDFRLQMDYNDELPDLQGRDLENGLSALIEFLTKVRHNLMREINQLHSTPGSPPVKSNKKLLQIIDTTLLKCYLQQNDALVASLLRLPDNHCNLDESEKALILHQKYSELIILYQIKGHHQKALELLQKHSNIRDSPLKGPDRTIQYLQHLGKDHLDYIFKFSLWVLQEHPEEGLKIFTEDLQEVEQLPRPKVLDFLLKTQKPLVIPYLEHLIFVWKETGSVFHNALIHQYRECLTLAQEELKGEMLPGTKAGEEPGRLGEYRKRLLDFLETSTRYTPATILVQLPYDSLYEERAILLGKLSKHKEALAVYVHILADLNKAIEYCEKKYNRNVEHDKEVYAMLVNMLIHPKSEWMGGMFPFKDVQPDVPTALQLLQDHPHEMDPLQILNILPSDTALGNIIKFLKGTLELKVVDRRKSQILKGLLFAEHLQVQEERIKYQSQNIGLTDLNVCAVCKKRFGNQSAFARYPNGDVVHYSCQDRK